MPANKKYFSTPGQRVLKITAAFIGGYLVALSSHLFLMNFFSKKNILSTTYFSMYILWGILMLLAFLFKNGWKVWALYLGLTILFLIPYFSTLFNK